MFIKSDQIICIPVLILTIFVESKYIMVSKEELRKLDKEKLVDLVYDLLIKVDALTAQGQLLHAEVKRLKTPKNSGNSSLPPSLDFFSLKNQSLREKSNKKTGGQPGHKGETLLMSPDPDKVIEHKPDGICPRCGKIHPEESFELTGKRQVIDKYMSITTISMSEGTVYNLLNKAANMVLPIYEGIKEEIAHLFRELNYFQELYHIKWVTDVKDVLSRAINLKNRMTPKQYDQPPEERSALLDEFDRLINQELPDKYSKIFPLKKRLKKRKQQVFNFLYYPQVPYTNNGSSRQSEI